MAVLHGGGVVPALHLDQAGLLPGGLVVSPAHIGVGQNVVPAALLNLRRAVLHGLLRVQNKGQLLVFHPDGPDSLGRGHLILRDDHRHLVAVIADMPVQQLSVRHILVAGVQRPRMPRRGKCDVWHIEAGQNLHHAGDGLRRRGVHGLYKAMGNGGMADFHDQRAAVTEVVHVLGTACGLFIGVHALYALADAFAHWVPSFFYYNFAPGKGVP